MEWDAISDESASELKFFDTAVSSSIPFAASVVQNLALIPQGATQSSRIGRKVTIRSVEAHLSVKSTFGAAAAPAGCVSLWFVVDEQANGATFAVSDILETGTVLPHAMRNEPNDERFLVMKEYKFNMYPPSGVSGAFGDVNVYIDFYEPITFTMEFSGATGAISEIRSSNLALLVGASDATLNSLTTVTGFVRVRFEDR